ncbi:MAG: hypothetical protein LQ342_006422 [Letrouitia transgressa]|nr:MAG: hypothetical protein LQ342_006422 [Letrouitia transgressa]
MGSPSNALNPSDSPIPQNASTASVSTQGDDFGQQLPVPHPSRPAAQHMVSEPPMVATMTSSSTPLGNLNAARRPGPPPSSLSTARAGALPQDMQAKMKAFHLSRQGTPSVSSQRSNSPASPPPVNQAPGGSLHGDLTATGAASPNGSSRAGSAGFRPSLAGRTQGPNFSSSPAIPNLRTNPKLSLAAKRGISSGLKLSDASPNSPSPLGPATQVGDGGETKDSDECTSRDHVSQSANGSAPGSLFSKYSEFVDTKTGSLMFKGKAIIHGKGIDFSGGSSFNISLDEIDNLEELGKGNYGTVYRVRHSRPQIRRPGFGLSISRASSSKSTSSPSSKDGETPPADALSRNKIDGTSGIVMAMKEIRLELDEAKFAAIIMELDILHRCVSPFIIDFYGAFFQEGAVYICMEFMDGGSVDKLYGDGVPEGVLRKIAISTTMGLKTLKDDHNIIHRDVKPTNILVNTAGQVKICDFGVSGNLVASIAKTNIGCQSYMAPERIATGGVAQAGANPGGGTYSVQSDIWSLGLSIIECAMGQYPYPPETYNNIFSQLSAIVDGEPPDLPNDFSEPAKDFVQKCLNKTPKLRPTYAMLLRHAWLAPLLKPPTISEDEEQGAPGADNVHTTAAGHTVVDKEVADWVCNAIERRRNGSMGKKVKPALHAAPLDAVPSPPPPVTEG